MNSSDEGGAELRQLSQAEILQLVEDGLFSPEHAEKWAKNHNYPPFAPGPVDTPAGSETDHQWWTLPMAAAWFTWRSRRAVHHQSKSARTGWKRWVVVDPASIPFVRPKCRVTDFGEPKTWDVFSEAMQDPRIPLLQRVVRPRPAPSLSDLRADLPYRRLKKALQSGILTATRVTKGQRDLVSPAYWRASFDAYASEPSNTSRSALKAGIFFRPSDVRRAETLVARGEFDRPIIGLEQALGWIAYRNLEKFRSLGKFDLRGKRYYGASYDTDYDTILPDKELFDALAEGRIKGFRKIEGNRNSSRKWEELTLTTRIESRSIWDHYEILFFRMSLIEVWPPLIMDSGFGGPLSRVAAERISQPTDDNKIDQVKRGTKRTGPEPKEMKRVITEMRADIAAGRQSLPSLKEMLQKQLIGRYHVKSRSTALKALKFLQDEADGLSATNSGQ
jgi:hypothetical protein